MTECEKMLSGALYDPSNAALCAQRARAHTLSARFNRTGEDEPAVRTALLRELLGAAGENLTMFPQIQFDYGCNTYVGRNGYFNFNCTILDCAEVRFGDNVFVGPNCAFLAASHPLLARERNVRAAPDGRLYNLEYAKPITVGDDVWLGGNVTVCAGVSIGAGAVIGAGSVVTRDIPPGVVAAGVPCRPLRPLTEDDRMER